MMANRKFSIKAVRVFCGYSQEEFAKKLGVSRQTVSNWETNRACITPLNLRKIIDLTGIPAKDIILPEQYTNCILSLSEA